MQIQIRKWTAQQTENAFTYFAWTMGMGMSDFYYVQEFVCWTLANRLFRMHKIQSSKLKNYFPFYIQQYCCCLTQVECVYVCVYECLSICVFVGVELSMFINAVSMYNNYMTCQCNKCIENRCHYIAISAIYMINNFQHNESHLPFSLVYSHTWMPLTMLCAIVDSNSAMDIGPIHIESVSLNFVNNATKNKSKIHPNELNRTHDQQQQQEKKNPLQNTNWWQ